MASPFVISRPDGSERRVSGYRYAAPRPGTQRYSAARSRVDKLPPKVDLRPRMTPVENQGGTNSCVANAVAGAYEYLAKRHRGDDAYDVSRMFIYYNARKRSESEHEDEGSIIADAIESLREHGACSEGTWPYDEAAVNEEPSPDAYEEASQFLVEEMQQVPTDLDAWRHCLAEGLPIIFGISLFKSFDQHRRPGVVPMPSARESSRESHGGHAMLCVGYSDPDKLFIVRNSWGPDWGDGGYCYIPYGYLTSDKFNSGDSWIIKQLENVDFDSGTWGDESSLVGELDTELGKMSEEDFSAMLDAMGETPLEFRLGLVFLHGAGADGEISEEEIEQIAGYLQQTFDQLGSRYNPAKVLKNCLRSLDDQALLEESVALLGEYLPKPALASITTSLQEVIGTDGLADEEENFVFELVEAWQIEEGRHAEEEEASEDEEGDEEEEESEDEESEGEESEEEEEEY